MFSLINDYSIFIIRKELLCLYLAQRLSRGLKEIVGADRVITDETVLKKNSIDRFRKFPDIHGIYTLPIPAAVVKLVPQNKSPVC